MGKTLLVTMECDKGIRQAIEERISGLARVVFLADLDDKDRAGAFKEAQALLFMKLGQELKPGEFPLLSGPQLLQSVPAGVDTIPLDKMPQGPVICANSGGWAEPFGEYALGLMIALGKELVRHSTNLGRGDYTRDKIRYFKGQTAGIVGFGGIGKNVAQAVAGIGMRIMALNTSGATDEQVDFIGTLDDLDRLLQESDVVFLSIPLKSKNHSLIGARELALMKEDAILINLARGPVVDEDALYEHLKTHPEFMFGSDVWWREPVTGEEFSLKHPIFDFPNVLGTPHNADLVEGMLGRAVDQAVDNLVRFLEGKPLTGIVTRSEYL